MKHFQNITYIVGLTTPGRTVEIQHNFVSYELSHHSQTVQSITYFFPMVPLLRQNLLGIIMTQLTISL